MRLWFLLFVILALTAADATPGECPFTLEGVTQVTNATGNSQTARGNGRCIAVDTTGTAHLVWEDQRDGNFEIYYASMAGARSPETRITRTGDDSNFPCIACDGNRVYILWQEKVNKVWQIFYVCLVGGKEIARTQITNAPLGAECPATAVGPDGTLHVAWHQGVGTMTTIHYGKIVDHNLVIHTPICNQHPAAFRPDIACDSAGRILIAWFEGTDVKSRLWDGTVWQDELLVAQDKQRSWRMSVASLADGNWAVAWFDQALLTTDVWAAFFDGEAWSAKIRVNEGQTGFYPAAASFSPGRLMVVWEDQDKTRTEYLLMMRCFDGHLWGVPSEIARGRAMSRYASLAPAGNLMHLIWFGAASGNNEIYHCLLRSK